MSTLTDRPGFDPAPRRRRFARATLALATALLLAGCSTPALRDSRALWVEGRFEEAVDTLKKALARDPDDLELRAAYNRQRELAVSQLTIAGDAARTARRHDEAEALYERAAKIDPANPRVREGQLELAAARRQERQVAEATRLAEKGEVAAAEAMLRGVVAENPRHVAARRLLQALRSRQSQAAGAEARLKTALAAPVTLDFRDAPLRSVFDALSRMAGLNFVFDRDVRGDTKITLMLRGSPVDDALRLILATNGLEQKVLNDNSLLIYPNTQAKSREYQDVVVRTFFLANGEAKQAQALLRAMIRTRDIFVDDKLNMLTIRDTPEAIRLAERLIETIDVAEAEVMLEVEVLEVSRTRLLQLGVSLPTEVQRVDLLNSSRVVLGNTNLGTTIANPLLRFSLLASDSDSNLLANPRIRVKNREKARVLIGQKLPAFTTTNTANVGSSTSVSYLDVGLKLEVEPTVSLDDEVTIKVQLEVNSNLGEVKAGDGTTAYQIGTRTAQTALRLRDGETQVLAGLINDNDTESATRVPGLGHLPLIGRLFSNTTTRREKTEVILLITPRVLRNLVPPDFDTLLLPAGTETSAGARPLTIAPTAPRALALSGEGMPAGARAAAPSPTSPMGARAARAAAQADPSDPAAAAAAAAQAEQAARAREAHAAGTEGSAEPAESPPQGPLAAALRVPEQVSIGRDFTVTVEVAASASAVDGTVVLSLGAGQLQAAGGGNRATVPLTRGSSGVLNGSVSVRVLSAGSGTAQLSVMEGRVREADGSQVPVVPGAGATVRIGL